jgi:hypothetical protein
MGQSSTGGSGTGDSNQSLEMLNALDKSALDHSDRANVNALGPEKQDAENK